MATQLLAQQHALLAGYRLTGQLNQIVFAVSTAELDATTYGNLTVIHQPGLKGASCSFNGFWNSTEESALFNLHRTEDQPVSIGLTDGTAGSPAVTMEAALWKHNITGRVGELLRLESDVGITRYGPVRGLVAHNTESSGNVTGTAYELGAVSATQHIYAALHVFDGDGDLDVIVESDTASNFPSATTRITFTQVADATAIASEFMRTAGAITDTWWRISATNPSTRDFAVVFGIR